MRVFVLLFGRGACFVSAVRVGGVFHFLPFGLGRALPPKQQKMKHAPAQTAKRYNTRKAQTTNKTRQQKHKHSYPDSSGLRNLVPCFARHKTQEIPTSQLHMRISQKGVPGRALTPCVAEGLYGDSWGIPCSGTPT